MLTPKQKKSWQTLDISKSTYAATGAEIFLSSGKGLGGGGELSFTESLLEEEIRPKPVVNKKSCMPREKERGQPAKNPDTAVSTIVGHWYED